MRRKRRNLVTNCQRQQSIKKDGEVLQEAAAEKESLVRVIEVATAGQFEQKEIKISAEPKRVPLKVIQTLEADPNRHWVIRRATSKRIEVWLPRHGWLLDAKGKLINEARPPRRDGDGRDCSEHF